MRRVPEDRGSLHASKVFEISMATDAAAMGNGIAPLPAHRRHGVVRRCLSGTTGLRAIMPRRCRAPSFSSRQRGITS